MAAVTGAYTEQLVEAAGISVELRRGGHGSSLLVIHGEHGVPGWLEAYQRLAETYDVIVPSLPGYGRSTRPDWIMGVHDLAAWVTWFARDLDIAMPVNVIGCSLGGWVAAEIATIAPQFLRKMVIAGAMGLKPQAGEIFDYAVEVREDRIGARFPSARAVRRVRQILWRGMDQHAERTCGTAS